MKPITHEWVAKAEQDLLAAATLIRLRRQPLLTIVCYHCQQCVEKYLKARLQEADIPFPKTHDLEQLLDLVLAAEPLWETFRAAIGPLTEYAVEARYPGSEPAFEEAQRALTVCKHLRDIIRKSLGLEGNQPEFRVRERKAAYRTRKRKK